MILRIAGQEPMQSAADLAGPCVAWSAPSTWACCMAEKPCQLTLSLLCMLTLPSVHATALAPAGGHVHQHTCTVQRLAAVSHCTYVHTHACPLYSSLARSQLSRAHKGLVTGQIADSMQQHTGHTQVHSRIRPTLARPRRSRQLSPLQVLLRNHTAPLCQPAQVAVPVRIGPQRCCMTEDKEGVAGTRDGDVHAPPVVQEANLALQMQQGRWERKVLRRWERADAQLTGNLPHDKRR